ncbi:hypothetical protein SAMN05421820_103324 [Pedobacter steynii]|uniref:Uncharacterized protein n=1 Tax=Pedobacter steynii TaxID=430522 RepID=A0A1G9RQW1_9SPHI|nr:hypothetical protein [Pedobacter steynii]NQX37681.1 hypothetical protein [Pedobacter steynii]SDM25534.1 hypothetical protein SAMN05421820_103324 [Pedobacter steynii]
MKAVSRKKLKAIGISLGVKITVDKTLNKYAKITSGKTIESNELLANSIFNF